MMIIHDTTTQYMERTIDSRIVAIIQAYISKMDSILDLGSGSGLYGKFLRKKCDMLIGLDYDKRLCTEAFSTGFYTRIFHDDVKNIQNRIKTIDAIFCSELLEHIKNTDLPEILQKMEAVCNKQIILTMPNPLSPHFGQDPTHIASYTIYSMLRLLRKSKTFNYTMYPIGFSERNLDSLVFRIINPIAKRISLCSPTVLYIGTRKDS